MRSICLIQPQYFRLVVAPSFSYQRLASRFLALVFIIVVMMFAERGPTKSRHDFVEKQIKKDHSAYSSTR
jgi:hypothetical protein